MEEIAIEFIIGFVVFGCLAAMILHPLIVYLFAPPIRVVVDTDKERLHELLLAIDSNITPTKSRLLLTAFMAKGKGIEDLNHISIKHVEKNTEVYYYKYGTTEEIELATITTTLA